MKLTVYKVINKSLIAWGIKNNQDLPIYYAWDQKKVPSNPPFIYLDYNPDQREWDVKYLSKDHKVYCSTIDDITGGISISTYNLFDNMN